MGGVWEYAGEYILNDGGRNGHEADSAIAPPHKQAIFFYGRFMAARQKEGHN